MARSRTGLEPEVQVRAVMTTAGRPTAKGRPTGRQLGERQYSLTTTVLPALSWKHCWSGLSQVSESTLTRKKSEPRQ
ncbi:hypothetical protein P3T35_006680 [Kitasatospora sp. GP30]|nr:hypothetical protein [Kitasatospora sp. GP30]